MQKALLIAGFLGAAFLLSGCNTDDPEEDHRNTEEKLSAPAPDYATRRVIACPKCGAPQKPYRITDLKNYYRCSGQPPKFKYHPEREWSYRLCDEDKKKGIEK
jgi:hypothetical protein